ncbi:MAG: response regulator [Candidatus Ancaeobacter aquaticus]|nr:response regulator [Candidatus Ancaeobacter aquaticus]
MKKHILVVDDEKEIRDILETFLEKHGYTVTATENGAQAVDIMESTKVDCMILDMRMPETSGQSVLKKMAQKGIAVPVIILTGSQDVSGNFLEIQEMGYEDILFKPIDLNVILELIQKKIGE